MPSLFGRTARGKKSSSSPSVHVDELGRPALKRSFSDSATRAGNAGNALALDEELQLMYGYWPVEPSRSLDTIQTEAVVRRCGQQIKSRCTLLLLLGMGLMGDKACLARCCLQVELWGSTAKAFQL
jgi:hypothetical protein